MTIVLNNQLLRNQILNHYLILIQNLIDLKTSNNQIVKQNLKKSIKRLSPYLPKIIKEILQKLQYRDRLDLNLNLNNRQWYRVM